MGLFGFETSSERRAREAEERKKTYERECETAEKRRSCDHVWRESSQTRFNSSTRESQVLRTCSLCGKTEWW